MMKIKSKFSRLTAGVLSLTILTSGASAAAPVPQTDEAVYVNLDEYGVQSDVRIVKGVNRNGATRISDFGRYSEVNNLTSHDKPIISADGVSFDLKDVQNERFYFECVPENSDSLQMPWTFDVSYKLNGKPVKAEDLAGVNGLVEITIHAVPNPNADEYYRNNMTLLVGTGVNMDKASTIEAEGAQIQSLGSYKCAVFVGLPSEENTYVIRIGAEDFEFPGVYFLMAPATMSQLDMVSDLREAKDDLNGARSDLYNGLSSMLSTMGSMQSGLGTMQAGISGIDEVRKQLIDSRQTIDPSLDNALNQLEILAGDTNALIPTLETTQTDVNTLNMNMTDILTSVTNTRDSIQDYKNLLSDVRNNLKDIQNLIDDLSEKTDKDKLTLKYVSEDLSSLGWDGEKLSISLENLRKSLSALREVEQTLQNIIANLDIAPELKMAVSHILSVVQPIASDTDVLLKDLSNASEDLGYLSNSMSSFSKHLNEINDVLNDYRGTASESAELAQNAVNLIENSLTELDTTLSQIDSLNQTLQTVNTNTNTAIDQIKTTTTSLSQTIALSNKALTDTRDTIRSLREKADSATQKSLDGLLDVIGKAAGSNDTKALQNATDSIHNTITNEVNEIENDSNILNIDNSLSLKSFTSEKNPAPSSLQFIVRTKEIAKDEMKEVQQKIANEQDEGVFARIGNIFKKIFNAIKSAF